MTRHQTRDHSKVKRSIDQAMKNRRKAHERLRAKQPSAATPQKRKR